MRPLTVIEQESLRPEKAVERAAKIASPLPSFAQLPLPVNRGGSCVEISLSDGTIVRDPAHHLEAVQLVFNAFRRDGQGARIGETIMLSLSPSGVDLQSVKRRKRDPRPLNQQLQRDNAAAQQEIERLQSQLASGIFMMRECPWTITGRSKEYVH